MTKFSLKWIEMDRFKVITKDRINDLPKTAGVYCFVSSPKPNPKPYSLNPIYIGKAINIQNRVKDHFKPARNASHSDAGGAAFKDSILSEKTTHIGYFETNSEIEALILEANLIKKYQPKFNVVWRDDKNYFYVAIAENKNGIPYVFITHQKNYEKTEYIGPFVEGTALKKTLRFLRRVFPYYTTGKHPKVKCTYCHLDLCPGPARNASQAGLAPRSDAGGSYLDLADYKKNIKKLVLILKGKRIAVLNSLKKEMITLSKENKFEEAGKTKDRIYNLQQVMSHTHVIENEKNSRAMSDVAPILKGILGIKKDIHRIECYDVSNIQGKFATSSMIVFIDGVPDKSQYKKFKIGIENTPNDVAMLKETLQRRLAHQEWIFPEVILIDGGKAQLNVAINTKSEILNSKQIQNIKIISIAKGKQELFIENKKEPVPLKNLPQEVYNLIKNLDDEAHRFAITYHKKLRKKSLLH